MCVCVYMRVYTVYNYIYCHMNTMYKYTMWYGLNITKHD